MSNARFEPHFGITSSGDDISVIAVVAGTAATDCTGLAPIAVGATGPLAMDVAGRLITLAIGNVPAGTTDSCNPVKIGAIASADSTTGNAAVVAGQRANIAADLNGRLLAMAQGNVAHDSPDTGFPLKTGGYAADEAPNLVSAVGDRVNGYFDRWGRQQMNFEKAIAGENLPLNVLRVVRGKLAVEQESWQGTVIDNVTGQLIKASAGRLGRIQIINTSATALFVILHDSTTFTALGPIKWRGFVVAAAGGVPGVLDMDFSSDDGLYFEIGISVSTSTAVNSITGAVAIYGNTLFV